MKKILFMVMLMSVLVFAKSETLPYALNDLKGTTQSFMLTGSFILLVVGIILAGVGVFLYHSKIKDKENVSTLLKVLVFGLAGLGACSLLGGVGGIIIYLLVPFMIDSMLA
ncbi:hypothetical protein KKE92_06065 [Candidatus Micrarchaeota archaeon]|nr:hypothetical protein [Candidatus Micrarchaeota archaeon]